MVLTLYSSEPNITYHLLVMANGVVIMSEDRRLPDSNSIEVKLTPGHTPLTTVLVYAKVGSELLADSKTFTVQGALSNKVVSNSISFLHSKLTNFELLHFSVFLPWLTK